MRILFLGTPSFATIPLAALAADGQFTIVGVVTQPDRSVGRSGVPQPPPVKRRAIELGLDAPILQPETLRDPAVAEQIAALRPDVGVVAAYGEILRRDLLGIPSLGYLNIHPSLLPRHRGPGPVSGAILAGDDETGVTVMLLEHKMDAGPILAQLRRPLPPDARAGALTDALFHQGSALLIDALPRYAAGALTPVVQDEAQATYTSLLTRADGNIDWTSGAAAIERMTRAYDPWPGATTTIGGQPLKIIAAAARPALPSADPPGTLRAFGGGAAVSTGDGALELLVVQPAGKRPMAAGDWYRGLRGTDGLRLGTA